MEKQSKMKGNNMLKFLSNLMKVRSKNKKEEPKNVIPLHEAAKNKDIKWIRKNLGVQRTDKGCIVHAINCELEPEEIIELIKNMIDKGEL